MDFANILVSNHAIIIFSLAVTLLFTFIFSYVKIQKYKKDLQKTIEAKEQIHKQHNEILSQMGKNIHDIVEENIDVAKKLTQSKDIASINQNIHFIENSENKLLSIATNLLEFLQLKSKKIQISNEKLNLSNLLNDVSGNIKSIVKQSPLELHYIVEKNVPQNIIADTLHLSKILLNIILYTIENKANRLALNISISKNDELTFNLTSNLLIDARDSDAIFSAQYDPNTGKYHSLGLFVARELSALMNGTLYAQNNDKGFLEFICKISFSQADLDSQKNFTHKSKVLIIDTTAQGELSCKNIFESLQCEVHTEKNPQHFSEFDLIVVDESLLTKTLAAKLTNKQKIIVLSNLFASHTKHTHVTPSSLLLHKPLTTKQVEDILHHIYEKPQVQIAKTTKKLPIYKEEFVDFKDVTLSKFSKFRQARVLLVEDNFINQKVLLGILSKSGVIVEIANNGQEALDILQSDNKFEIIFMDINMPIMDGYTAAKHIRANSRYDSIAIIALSALTSKMEIESMFDAGMNAYLSKPLKKEKLFSALFMFIQNKQQERRESIRYEERTNILTGLNIDVGIDNSNSNHFFYQEILKEFQAAYGESDKLFKKLVEEFRYEQLRMLCLDIRGLSASIGAEDMNLLSAEVLKLLLFKKYEILKDFVPLYAKSLERLNHSIDNYIKS